MIYEVKLLVKVNTDEGYGSVELKEDMHRVVGALFPSGEFAPGGVTDLLGISATHKGEEVIKAWWE